MKYSAGIFSACYGLATLLCAVGFSWLVLAKANYAYGLWHDQGGIAEAIELYGPQNRYRKGFAQTTRKQRVILFSQISHSVHNSGRGLEKIRYRVPGQADSSLLHESEIVHLQDVSRVIDLLTIFLGVISLLWVAMTGFMLISNKPLPAMKSQLVGLAVLLLAGVVLLSVVGWVKVFNQLHIWVFPSDHQWFFYYQDSLMSTMMWAPHLFKYIGISWVVMASLFFFALIAILTWLQRSKVLSNFAASLKWPKR